MESVEIKGEDFQQRIFVGTSGENVHISAMVVGGGAYMSINVQEAKKMIKALEQAIQHTHLGIIVDGRGPVAVRAAMMGETGKPSRAQRVGASSIWAIVRRPNRSSNAPHPLTHPGTLQASGL